FGTASGASRWSVGRRSENWRRRSCTSTRYPRMLSSPAAFRVTLRWPDLLRCQFCTRRSGQSGRTRARSSSAQRSLQ
ncbi:unnamed protein product, partial [Symbiodinium sp. CCMP2456]